MTLQPDDQFGHYTIRQHMAQGGAGDVYRAEDTRSGQDVALKIPTKSIMYDPRQYDFFLRELAALPQLNHSAIQHYRESGNLDGTPYLVTTLIEGRSLRGLIKDNGTLPVDRAIILIRATAEGLAYCHSQGVIHRDIKPENILVTPADQTVIIDFGLAITKKRPAFGTPGGTPDYMAPEQVQGNPEDRRVDIYQLGTVFYEALTGCTPFTGDDPLTVMHLRLRQAVPRLDKIRPDIPLPVATVIARCLQVKPEQRYADMAALIADLDHLDQVDISSLEALSLPPPKPSFWQSPPGKAISTTAAFFIGIAVLTIILVALKH